ncbi:hypothetical protein [Brevibacillus laterosporus]|uniref:hypothetical protein n=1 Tax=Brevibacillus laterosporus TaxID=1465 RepID=UPI002651D08C|nr:hypothetical protein [Brevibacillus laterosporus]MDN9011686.1 hypothetical protein [Brevibacillus laterosporus]MDO0942686.1 hypothetical protein [Brevibacillus laterosporus]
MKKQALLAVCTLTLLVQTVPSFPGMISSVYAAENALPATQMKLPSLTELDKNVIETMKKAMQSLAEGVEIELDEIVGQNPSSWVVKAKNNRGNILVDKKTGEVKHVNVRFSFEEVKPSLQESVMRTLKGLDGKQTFKITSVERTRWEKENVWLFRSDNLSASVLLDALTEQVISAGASYKTEQIDPSKVKTAEKAIKVLSNNQSVQLLPTATIYTSPKESIDKVWSFGDKQHGYSVYVGAKTGKLVSVSSSKEVDYVSEEERQKVFAKPFYTKEKAILAASPIVKKWFQLDLKGYDVSVHYNEYTFTKKGMPTIKASINKKGAFWNFSIKPEQGLMN